MVEASGSQATHQDSLILEQEKSITTESPGAFRKKQRVTFALENTNHIFDRDEDSGTPLDPKPPNSNDGVSCCSALDHRDEPSDALNPAMVNNREITEYQQEWPFIKQSPFWDTLESLDIYKNPPQKPHFFQLKKIKKVSREGEAIGHMVTFANVVKRTSKLQLDDPNDVIQNIEEILVVLEAHGFDVGAVKARLNGFLSRKAEGGELKDELKEGEKELENLNLEKSKIAEEVDQLEAKMQELQEKLVETVKKKEVKDEEISLLQSNLDLVSNQITDKVVALEKLAATPL